MILNYGLKYSDFDRMVETIPTIRKVLPIREIRKQIRRGSYYLDGRVVGTTEDYADFNLLADGERAVPDRVGQREVREFRGARRRDRREALPLRRPARPVDQARHRLLHGRRRHARSGRARRGSAAAWPLRTSTRTCTSRSTPASSGSASGSSTTAPARRQAEETQLTQITIQVGSMDDVLPTVPADRSRLRALSSQERRREDRPLRPAAAGREAGAPVHASSWGRSRRSRSWSAASAS